MYNEKFRLDVSGWIRAKEHHYANGSPVPFLVHLYNSANHPAILRTEREHKFCRAAARWAMRRLKRLGGWYRSDYSGKLVVR